MTAITQQSLALELSNVDYSATGAAVTGPVDPDQVTQVLAKLATTESWSKWVVGDLFNALAHSTDDAAAHRAVAGLGFENAWLATAWQVAKRVPAEHRDERLSWGHHQVIARECIEVSDQPTWLSVCRGKRWTVRELTDAVDKWENRDQGELDGMDAGKRWRMPKVIERRIADAVALDPDVWVTVHPATGEVRVAEGRA